MEIINGFPPNYAKIKGVLNPPKDAVFAYGDVIYNPSKGEIYPDLYVHEQTHQKQQKDFGNVELWWNKYLLDKDFREKMEVEAYAVQYIFVKERIPARGAKECLESLAFALSSPMYGLQLTYQQAETKIRHKAK